MNLFYNTQKKYEIIEDENFSSSKETSILEIDHEFVTAIIKIEKKSDSMFSYKIEIPGDLISQDPSTGISNKIRIGQIGYIRQNDLNNDKSKYDSLFKVLNVYLWGGNTIIEVITDKNIRITNEDEIEISELSWNCLLKQSDKTKLEYPKNIFISEYKNDIINLNKKCVTVKWDSVSLATTYAISYRKCDDPINYAWTYIHDISETKYEISNLDEECDYSVCVAAIFGNMYSFFSSELFFKT